MSYSTGELAELCGVTVRTIQYYDGEGLLKPVDYSEGGRRLYGDEELKTLQIICMYKELGLSLTEIKSVLSDEANCKKILLSILAEKEKSLDKDIRRQLSRRDGIRAVKKYLSDGVPLSRNSFFDVQTIMKGKTKLRLVYGVMFAVGILCDAVIITTAVLWGVKGWWLPFAIGVPCMAALVAATVAAAYRNLAYICSVCGKKFRPRFGEFFMSRHTFRTRRLTCPHCAVKNFHAETYSD